MLSVLTFLQFKSLLGMIFSLFIMQEHHIFAKNFICEYIVRLPM